jgi:hypothetical protein
LTIDLMLVSSIKSAEYEEETSDSPPQRGATVPTQSSHPRGAARSSNSSSRSSDVLCDSCPPDSRRPAAFLCRQCRGLLFCLYFVSSINHSFSSKLLRGLRCQVPPVNYCGNELSCPRSCDDVPIVSFLSRTS